LKSFKDKNNNEQACSLLEVILDAQCTPTSVRFLSQAVQLMSMKLQKHVSVTSLRMINGSVFLSLERRRLTSVFVSSTMVALCTVLVVQRSMPDKFI
jgi:hypothetical protein